MSASHGSKNSQDRYLKQVTSILRQALQDAKYLAYLFGSRAVGRHTETSDLDVAVLASSGRALTALEESPSLPFSLIVRDAFIQLQACNTLQ